MGRRRKGDPPRYRHHKHSGEAVVSLPTGNGTYRDQLLGAYDTPESRQEYARVLGEWEGTGRTPPPSKAEAGLSVNELILTYYTHAVTYYRPPDGAPTSEADNIRLAL